MNIMPMNEGRNICQTNEYVGDLESAGATFIV